MGANEFEVMGVRGERTGQHWEILKRQMHQDLIIYSKSGAGSRKTSFPRSSKQVPSLQGSIKKEECVGDVKDTMGISIYYYLVSVCGAPGRLLNGR